MAEDPRAGFPFLRTLFRWRNHPEGTQIQILPDAPPVDEQELFRAFLAAGVLNANASSVAALLRDKPPGWVRVGKPFEFKDESATAVFSLRVVGLVASVRVEPSLAREQGREICQEEILDLLARNGVVHGVDPELVGVLVRPNCAAGWYDVAVGEEPVDGTDTVIECRVAADHETPQHGEDGTVDFRDRGALPEIDEGTAVYARVPGRPARDGMDLSGKPLPAKPGKDAALAPGPGLRLREGDPDVLEAAFDGFLLKGRDGRLQVGRVFEVKGDLDLAVGNIRYHGPVSIGGNVPTGFSIHAGGDISIRGTAAGADIRTDAGSIRVEGGVFGGRLEATADIAIAFGHEAELVCGGRLDGGKYLQHCTSRCGTLSFARAGMIVGGRSMASSSIECDVLGTEAGTPTFILLCDPEEEKAREELERIAVEEKKIHPIHELLEQKVVQLKARLSGGGQLLGRAREDAEETLKQYTAVMDRLREMERRKARDQEILAITRERSGFVSIRREIHPGAEVHIFGRRFEIDSVRPPVRLVAKDREVEALKQ